LSYLYNYRHSIGVYGGQVFENGVTKGIREFRKDDDENTNLAGIGLKIGTNAFFK